MPKKAVFHKIESPPHVIRRAEPPPEPASAPPPRETLAPPTGPTSSSQRLRQSIKGGLSKRRADELIQGLTQLGYSRRESRERLINAGVTDEDTDEQAMVKALSEAATTPPVNVVTLEGETVREPETTPGATTPPLEETEPLSAAPSSLERSFNEAVNRVTPAVQSMQNWLANRPTPGGVGGMVLVLLLMVFVMVPVKGKQTRLSLLWGVLMGNQVIDQSPKTPGYDVAAQAGQWVDQVGKDIIGGVVRGVPEIATEVATKSGPTPNPGLNVLPGIGAYSTIVSEAEQILKDLGINP